MLVQFICKLDLPTVFLCFGDFIFYTRLLNGSDQLHLIGVNAVQDQFVQSLIERFRLFKSKQN